MHPINFLRILALVGAAMCPLPSLALAYNGAANATASPADLALLSVRAPGRFVYFFDPYPVTIEVKNIGGQPSKAFAVNFYASDDSHITLGDWLLGKDSLPGLAPDESITFTSHKPIFITLVPPPGPWYIGAMNTLNDSNTGNNVNFDPLPVARPSSTTFVINKGLNDTWRNKDTRGQGFFINVFPDTSPERPEPVMFVGWFTFDLERPSQGVTALLGEPGHRWLTAYGPYSGDTATLDIELTQGGIFDSSIPVPTQTPAYGTMTVQFTSCSEGVVSYDIPSVGVSGTVPIERVTNDNVALCESLQNP